LEAALGSVAVNSVPQVTNADASPVDAGLEWLPTWESHKPNPCDGQKSGRV
jgi:hypothetical protein